MNKEIIDIIQQTTIFQQCNQSFQEKLAEQSSICTFSKGQMVYMAHDKADKFYIILDGWVKLYRENIDGEQTIIDVLTTNHMFGDTAIFEDGHYPCSAEIVEQSRLVCMPLSLLKSEIEDNSKLAMSMMSSMARYRKQQDQEIENRTLKNAPQRVGCFLLRLTQQQHGRVIINLPYDKTLVASKLGMQPETFSRALNKLKDNVQISVNGGAIEVSDINELIDYACGCCSSEFPCHDLNV